MSERTIMIFPKFSNMEIIDRMRRNYDPLADLVRPHITLVFPFHSDIADAELGSHIENAISGIPSFFSAGLQGYLSRKTPLEITFF